jgi:hypothetical protein
MINMPVILRSGTPAVVLSIIFALATDGGISPKEWMGSDHGIHEFAELLLDEIAGVEGETPMLAARLLDALLETTVNESVALVAGYFCATLLRNGNPGLALALLSGAMARVTAPAA